MTTTSTVRAGGRVRSLAGLLRTTRSMVAAGTAVVMTNTVSNVGNNSRRGTNWLPPIGQPIGYVDIPMPDGSVKTLPVRIDNQYYLGFDEVFQRRLGGVKGQSLNDVATNVSATLAGVTDQSAAIAAIGQQVDAASAAAEASKQVLVAADVPGAEQIPPVPRREATTGTLE
jgi:hypothetical protein